MIRWIKNILDVKNLLGMARNAHVNEILFTSAMQDPTIMLLGSGTIRAEGISYGTPFEFEIFDPINYQWNLPASPGTQVRLTGDIEYLVFNYGFGCDISDVTINSNSLNTLTIDQQSILELTTNAELVRLDLRNNVQLSKLDISQSTNLLYLNQININFITDILTRANNSNVASAVAQMITDAIGTGTVHVPNTDAYYSTIANAATLKGWTIENL